MLVLIAVLEIIHASHIDTAIAVFVVGALATKHVLHALHAALEVVREFITKLGEDTVKLVTEARRLWREVVRVVKRVKEACRCNDDENEGK